MASLQEEASAEVVRSGAGFGLSYCDRWERNYFLSTCGLRNPGAQIYGILWLMAAGLVAGSVAFLGWESLKS